jgi:hypothetical protein
LQYFKCLFITIIQSVKQHLIIEFLDFSQSGRGMRFKAEKAPGTRLKKAPLPP